MTWQKEIEKNNVKKKMNIKKTKVSKSKKALYPTQFNRSMNTFLLIF
jgi:hypothetical protein